MLMIVQDILDWDEVLRSMLDESGLYAKGVFIVPLYEGDYLLFLPGQG